MEDYCLTIQEITNTIKISDCTAVKILLMLECVHSDPEFLKTMITTDECWIYVHDAETKAHPLVEIFTIPRPKKSRQVRRKVKVILIIFGCCRIMHYEYTPEAKPVFKHHYQWFSVCL